MALTARFPGTPCTECDELIAVGEQIVGSDPGWRHVACPDPLTVEHAPCPVCFLVHPVGRCDR